MGQQRSLRDWRHPVGVPVMKSAVMPDSISASNIPAGVVPDITEATTALIDILTALKRR